MKKNENHGNDSDTRIINPPAYPFTGRDLLENLRSRLVAESGHPVRFAELAKLMGQTTSTVHFWFSAYRHPHLVAFMSLLERLSPAERQAFIESHCRVFPVLSHERFVGEVVKVRALLKKRGGLTVITGSSDAARTFLVNAMGHSWATLCGNGSGPVGIDVHRPLKFVPIETLNYIDERLDSRRTRDLLRSIWPKLATSDAPLLIANGLLCMIPELREDLLRVAKDRHVLLAEQSMTSLFTSACKLPAPAHIVTLWGTKRAEVIRLTCRRLK